MDTLNEYYPLYPLNPDKIGLSESDVSDNENYVDKVLARKRIKKLDFDDFCTVHSDDIWYLWNTIHEFAYYAHTDLLGRLDFPKFCTICYENSS